VLFQTSSQQKCRATVAGGQSNMVKAAANPPPLIVGMGTHVQYNVSRDVPDSGSILPNPATFWNAATKMWQKTHEDTIKK